MRFLTGLAVLLSACTTEADPGKEHAPTPEATGSGVVFRDGCSASEFGPGALIGRRAESVPFAGYPFPVRVVKPGMAITMDYSPARLTVETDKDGVIVRHSCG